MFADGGSKSDTSTDGPRAANSALPNTAHGLHRLTEWQAAGRGLRLRSSLRGKRTR